MPVPPHVNGSDRAYSGRKGRADLALGSPSLVSVGVVADIVRSAASSRGFTSKTRRTIMVVLILVV
jgi:hypothetical protein